MPPKSMPDMGSVMEPGGSSLHLTTEQLGSLGLSDLIAGDSRTVTLTATDIGDDGATFDAEVESPKEDTAEPSEEMPEPVTSAPPKRRILSPRDLKGAADDFFG